MAIRAPIKEGFTVTQKFGENPDYYKQFGMIGHEGIDFGCPLGTPIYACFDGKINIINQGNRAYGLHIELTEIGYGERRQANYAHLSQVDVKMGDSVKAGDKIGYTGNSGGSSGPHLHFNFRRIMANGNYKNHDNGYFGNEDIYGKGYITQYNDDKIISKY